MAEKGNRCDLCTGCGRCFGKGEGITVLGDGGLLESWRSRLMEEANPDSQEERWVAAADIGTTTMAMVLYDAGGIQRDRFMTVNPQVRYGGDVLSRIQEAADPRSAARMREDVRRVLEKGIGQFVESMRRLGGRGLHLVIVGNTTMLYLLEGHDPGELGRAPFCASHLEGLCLEPAIPFVKRVSILPGLSAFVGADLVAGICACRMAEEDGITLLVDLGTNGEIVLGNHDRLLACATAAGPAFEGGATKGIWGADMVHLTARLLKEGLLDETGLLADPYFEEGVRIGGVELKQAHIRQLQLAKAAIGAGIETLIRLYGLKSPAQVDRVVLAGGFGYYLKAEDAGKIGLLPEKLVLKTESAGNTALAGALRYGFLQEETEKELERIRHGAQIVNLAEAPFFQERYIEAMSLEEWG